jgi:dipeptidyl-peptidase-4
MVNVASAAVPSAPLTIDRIFAAPDLSGAALRSPQISPDGRLVTYLQGSPAAKDRLDLWAWDVAARRARLLVAASALAPAEERLSAEEAQRRERQRTTSLQGIVEYQFSPDARALLVPLAGDLFLYDLTKDAAHAVRRLTNTPAAETDARFSPRGRYVSYVREQNLYALELASGREIALTQGGGGLVSFGTAEFIAQEEMERNTGYWWAPDDSRIAYTRIDETPVDEVERYEIGARRIEVVRQRYPAAGRQNVAIELWVAALARSTLAGSKQAGAAMAADRAPVRIDLGSNPDIYLARVDWLPDGSALAVQRQSRDQRELVLLRADAASGASRELLRETSPAWVPLHDELTFLPRRGQFIWASQRSGFKHLYLYDLAGHLVRALTSGPWMVTADGSERALAGVDEARGLVYFVANRDSPVERQLYVTTLDAPRGGAEPPAPRRISQQAGWHSVRMSKSARLWLDTWSDAETPPSLTLRRVDGSAVATLVANRLDASHPYAPYLGAHLRTAFGTLEAADGQVLHYQMLRPRDATPGERHPVIVDVYGGPGAQRVRNAWSGYPRGNEGYFRQILAQSGYVVFTLDNRGSGFRGTAFETALHDHLGGVEVADQVRGVQFLRSLPFVDGARIGVIGWSYGGYMALMCMTRAPDYFTAGVAGAPVTDWALYDTHYTERYMGTPAGNAAGYSDSSVLTQAAQLRGPLLILHGMADDNVLFTHSTVLIERLQQAGKAFSVMPYPGSKHGLLRMPVTGAHAYATIETFLDAALGAQP